MRHESQEESTLPGGSSGADEQNSGGNRSILTGCLIVLLAGGVVGLFWLEPSHDQY